MFRPSFFSSVEEPFFIFLSFLFFFFVSASMLTVFQEKSGRRVHTVTATHSFNSGHPTRVINHQRYTYRRDFCFFSADNIAVVSSVSVFSFFFLKNKKVTLVLKSDMEIQQTRFFYLNRFLSLFSNVDNPITQIYIKVYASGAVVHSHCI